MMYGYRMVRKVTGTMYDVPGAGDPPGRTVGYGRLRLSVVIRYG